MNKKKERKIIRVGKKIKKNIIFSRFLLISFVIFMIAACQPADPAAAKNEQENGYLQITIGGLNESNTLVYEVEFTCEGQPARKEIWGPQIQSEKFNLTAGYWTAAVTAKDNGILIAKGGTTNINIIKNETKQIAIILALISHNNNPEENDGENDGNEEEDNNENNEIEDPPDGDEQMLILTANAASGSAYNLILASGFDYESPDQTNGGHTGQSHIIQQYDSVLDKNVFAFITHRDTDRNSTGDWTRQRTEIKIDHKNNAENPGRAFCGLDGANEGRSFIYKWKFKLPADFAVSSEFTHIHQIKNEGGDSSQPVVALTARLSGGTQRLQLTYYAPGSSSPVYWVNNANSLGAYLGHWVQCEEKITFSSNQLTASYSLKITRIDNNQILMNYTAPAGSIYTWRTGNTHGRPKFGLYRRIFSGSNSGNFIEPDASVMVPGLKDEIILFADFEAIKIN